MKRKVNAITAFMAMLLLFSGSALAATSYYAQSLVIFNVPSDATFSVAMPSDYTSWTSIVSTSDYPSATALTMISFNFTSANDGTLIEPYEAGDSGNAQSGAAQPIYYIDNTGNTNEQFEIKLNQTEPSNVDMFFNATCQGTCGTVTTDLTAITDSYQAMATAVTTSSYLNVTLYANTSGASAGEVERYLVIKSTAV